MNLIGSETHTCKEMHLSIPKPDSVTVNDLVSGYNKITNNKKEHLKTSTF